MATDAKAQLFQALKAHTSELEIERDVASDRDLEALDRRIGAVRLLLEWLSKPLEPEPAASQQLKRRRHRDLKLIRIKVRCPNPANLKSPLARNYILAIRPKGRRSVQTCR
jgi:hypothetical protein